MAQHVLEEQKIDPIEAGLKVRSALNKKGRFCGIPNQYAPIPVVAALPVATKSFLLAGIFGALFFAALYHLYQRDPDAIAIYMQALKTNRFFPFSKAQKLLIKYI